MQAHQALALLVPQAPSSRRCPPSLCPYSQFPLRTVLGALDVRHGVAAGTQRLSASCYQKVLWCFQRCVFDVPLLLLAARVGFLLLVCEDENVLLLKYNQSRITQARDKQVEDKQDPSMKGCSHKELDKESYQQ